MLKSFGSATEAVLATLQNLHNEGCGVAPIYDKTSVGSLFGRNPRRTVEFIGEGFIIENPRARIAHFKARPLNVGFAIANFLWTISGADDLAMISFYNDKAKAFSPDGSRLIGSVGKRIFTSGNIDQFDEAIHRLTEDTQSRRAVILMFSPNDLASPPLDTPCSVSFQLMIRGGRLQWITHMRSQSAAMVMPYDLFLFTMLHEAASIALDIPMGRYHHFCGSMHYYEDESALVESMISERPNDSLTGMPPMDGSPFVLMNNLVAAEAFIRDGLRKNPEDPVSIDDFGLPAYWVDLLTALILSVKMRLGVSISQEQLEKVLKTYRMS